MEINNFENKISVGIFISRKIRRALNIIKANNENINTYNDAIQYLIDLSIEKEKKIHEYLIDLEKEKEKKDDKNDEN